MDAATSGPPRCILGCAGPLLAVDFKVFLCFSLKIAFCHMKPDCEISLTALREHGVTSVNILGREVLPPSFLIGGLIHRLV